MNNENLSETVNENGRRILYCDSNCVVVNKTAGESTEELAEGSDTTMKDLPLLLSAELASPQWPAAANDNPGNILPKPVAAHRLDVPVSGCTVFARTRSCLQLLNEAYKNNMVEKWYWAITEKPRNPALCKTGSEETELVHWLQSDLQKNKSFAYNEPDSKEVMGRKKAVLRYRCIGEGNHYLFLEIKLITGRHHQIRAQLAKHGLTIKGDLKYGAKRSEPGGGIRLHARSVTFPDPSADNGGKIITVQADPAPDNLWKAFMQAKFTDNPC